MADGSVVFRPCSHTLLERSVLVPELGGIYSPHLPRQSSMKSCCSLRLLIRWAKHDAPTERFTCSGCGQSYRYEDWQWRPIRTVDDIQDMMAQEHARQADERIRNH